MARFLKLTVNVTVYVTPNKLIFNMEAVCFPSGKTDVESKRKSCCINRSRGYCPSDGKNSGWVFLRGDDEGSFVSACAVHLGGCYEAF